jgi:hypothetical protein
VLAPTGTSWQITLATSGTLTVTDLEASGDQFQVFDNGATMSLASSPFTVSPQNPGQPGYIDGGSFTSDPSSGGYVGEDINDALGNAEFSSGTFALDSGVNVITIDYVGSVGDGDMAFIAESSTAPTPEPSSLALFGTGLVGVLVTFRRKLMA